jgi:hypothetical protein
MTDVGTLLGWYIGSRDGEAEASYFVLCDYYAVKPEPDVLYRSVDDDLQGPWVQVTERGDSELPHPPPVPQALCK